MSNNACLSKKCKYPNLDSFEIESDFNFLEDKYTHDHNVISFTDPGSRIEGKVFGSAYHDGNRNEVLINEYKEAVNEVDEDKLLEKYMDSVSQNIRDMEQRITDDRRESEKRITEDRRESEKRIGDERRLSEDRIQSKFDEAMNAIKEQNEKIDKKMGAIENKIDDKMDKIETKYENLKWWILGTCLTTILAVAGIIASLKSK